MCLLHFIKINIKVDVTRHAALRDWMQTYLEINQAAGTTRAESIFYI